MIFVLLAVLPTLVALLACAVCVPALVAWHVARATCPVDAPTDLASWDDVMADLDAPKPTLGPVMSIATTSSGPRLSYTPRRGRKPRNVRRYAPMWAQAPSCSAGNTHAKEELPAGLATKRNHTEKRSRGPPPPVGWSEG